MPVKWEVEMVNTKIFSYEVLADSKEEAKKKASNLHGNPETQDSPISDWDIETRPVED